MPDVERRRAFSTLRATVGLTPPAILRAASTKLEKITRLGGPIAASARASAVVDIIGSYPYAIGSVLTLVSQVFFAAWFIAVGTQLYKTR